MDKTSSIEVVTFGCRLNAVESEAIRRAAREAGHDNLVVFNTCAVTNEAVRQARQAIRRMKRERPDARLIVTGCAAQIDPDSFTKMGVADAVIGNADKAKPQTWASLAVTPTTRVNDIMALEESGHHFVAGAVDSIEGQTRAFVEIQNGCDHRCTFFIIPYGRGPSRSAAAGEVVEQIRKLVGNGYREAVLTGVDLTSWGHDLPGTPKLGRLLKQILQLVPDLKRLRLSSIDCIEADEEMLEIIAQEPRLMPHLHLSLQAGDDMILKRMKRRHLREDAIAFCADLRRARPDIVFGADLITGCPTESDAMFERTLDLVSACGLTHLHVFPFSPRPGTPAARMPQLGREIAKARAEELRKLGEQRLKTHLDAQIGKTICVLTERGGNGRAEDFTLVRTPAQEPGHIIEATVTGHDGHALLI
jgi:threonylcarbamoyladenosine tRNA methylthiotransferase MtaB